MGNGNYRPSWDEFWFTLALVYSTRATCDRLRTATVIVKKNRLVGAGYNGSIPGEAHCDEVGHHMVNDHCERTLHGEQNAIINTSREDLRGSIAYTLGTPCLRCFKELAAAGVVQIKCLGTYENALGREVLHSFVSANNINIIFYDYDPEYLLSIAFDALKRKGGRIFKE